MIQNVEFKRKVAVEKYKNITIDDLHKYEFKFNGIVEFEAFIEKIEGFYDKEKFVEISRTGYMLLTDKGNFIERLFRDIINDRIYILIYPDGPQIGNFKEITNVVSPKYITKYMRMDNLNLESISFSVISGEFDGKTWILSSSIGHIDGKTVLINYLDNNIESISEVIGFKRYFTYDVVD